MLRVCVWGVVCGAPVVCTFETPSVCTYITCGRFADTHGDVLNVHMGVVSSKKTHIELSFAPEVHQVTAGSYLRKASFLFYTTQ